MIIPYRLKLTTTEQDVVDTLLYKIQILFYNSRTTTQHNSHFSSECKIAQEKCKCTYGPRIRNLPTISRLEEEPVARREVHRLVLHSQDGQSVPHGLLDLGLEVRVHLFQLLVVVDDVGDHLGINKLN